MKGLGKIKGILASKGVTFAVPLRHMPYGIEFYVRDPDGYVLGFIQPTQLPNEPDA